LEERITPGVSEGGHPAQTILSTLPILWRGLSGTPITGNLKALPGEG